MSDPSMPQAAIIITTYNQPRYLELVLTSLLVQTVTDFELVIADDGSTPETRQLIERFQTAHPPFSIKYFWQIDDGFRVGEARNGAVRLATADWLIFLDGDQIVHPRFVESHLKMAANDRVLFGGRVKLSQSFSNSVRVQDLERAGIESLYRENYATCRAETYAPVNEGLGDLFSGWFIQKFGGDRHPAWDGVINSFSQMTPRQLFHRICFKSGGNFSTSRALIESVNGFDKRFNGLSNEDGELFLRICNAGATARSVLFSATAYHLWHREHWQRAGAQRDRAKFLARETRLTGKIRCETGLLNGPTSTGPCIKNSPNHSCDHHQTNSQ